MVFLVERLVATSLRCQWEDNSGLANATESKPGIFCLWHNRLAISMRVHRRHPRKLAALVSASKDGALLAAVLGKFGVGQVRGSSSRRGPQALLELTTRGKMGYDLAVTPDGPKGPRYITQAGVISLVSLRNEPFQLNLIWPALKPASYGAESKTQYKIVGSGIFPGGMGIFKAPRRVQAGIEKGKCLSGRF
jgi:lysophospholipid acyltransferase (LPLAT)-like uncharacterized protein